MSRITGRVKWFNDTKGSENGSHLAQQGLSRHGSQMEEFTRVLVAPSHLGLETRTDFRRAAVDLLDRLPENTGCLILDVTLSRLVDSAGLGTLVLIQQHAAARQQSLKLRGVSEELRMLLALTKLEDMFGWDVSGL